MKTVNSSIRKGAGDPVGDTSSAVKQRWNEKNYTQVKAWVPQEIAAGFKAECKAANISMASELTRFMSSGASPPRGVGKGRPLAIITRPQRRKAVEAIIQELQDILEAENGYIDHMPPGVSESARRDAADEAVEALEEALEALGRAY
jgi:hypothetical protein